MGSLAPPPAKKRCSKCREIKPIDAFSECGKTWDGKCCACKECDRTWLQLHKYGWVGLVRRAVVRREAEVLGDAGYRRCGLCVHWLPQSQFRRSGKVSSG